MILSNNSTAFAWIISSLTGRPFDLDTLNHSSTSLSNRGKYPVWTRVLDGSELFDLLLILYYFNYILRLYDTRTVRPNLLRYILLMLLVLFFFFTLIDKAAFLLLFFIFFFNYWHFLSIFKFFFLISTVIIIIDSQLYEHILIIYLSIIMKVAIIR